MIKNMLVAAFLMGFWGVAAVGVRAQLSSSTPAASSSGQDNKQISDADIEALRKDLRAKKKEAVAINLNHTRPGDQVLACLRSICSGADKNQR